ncbi:MAG: MFS transporter, partial [Runella slithyformis]
FDWKRANPLGSLRQLQKYPAVMGLVASLFFIYVAGHATQGIWSYYVMEKFGWNQDLVGYSLGFVGLMVAIVQGGLTRVLIPKLGQQRAVFVGLSFYALGFVLFAFASQGWMMYAFMIPYSLGGLAGPSLQAIISGYVPPNEQGELQGALTSLVSITSIIGPLFMTNLFAYFTSDAAPFQFPGAAFIAGAVFTLVSLALSIRPLTTNK